MKLKLILLGLVYYFAAANAKNETGPNIFHGDLLVDILSMVGIDNFKQVSLVSRDFANHAYLVFPQSVNQAIRKFLNDVYGGNLTSAQLKKTKEKLTKSVTTVTPYQAAQKSVLFWRVVGVIECVGSKLLDAKTLDVVCEQLSGAIMNFVDDPDIYVIAKNSSHHISAVDHYHVLLFLTKALEKKHTGFELCYAYSRFVTKTFAKEWETEFTWSMVKWKSLVFAAGEAFSVLKIIQKHTVEKIQKFQYKKERQFKVNFKSYKSSVKSTAKEKLDLAIANKAVNYLHRLLSIDDKSKDVLNMFAMVYCAIQNLDGPNFQENVLKTKLILGRFDAVKDESVAKLRKSLSNTCEDHNVTEILNTGLDELKKSMAKSMGKSKLSSKELTGVMYSNKTFKKEEDKEKKSGQKDLESYIRKTIDELPTEQNLQKYIQLLTTVLSIDRVKYDLQKLVFDAYFVRAISVDIFNNTSVTELELIDTKLNLLVNDEDKYFYANPVIGKEVERQARLNTLFQSFVPVWTVHESSKPEFGTKEKIILKHAMGSIASPGRFITHRSVRIMKIFKPFYFIARTKWEMLNDQCLLSLWNEINGDLPQDVKEKLLDEDESEFNIIHRPLEKSEINPLVFLIHLRVAYYMANTSLNADSQIRINIQRLEDKIGDATDYDPFLQDMVSERKFEFYSKEARERQQKDFDAFVKTQLELIINHPIAFDLPFSDRTAASETVILESVYIAINDKSKPSVHKSQAARLDELTLTTRGPPNSDIEKRIRKHYNDCKDRLKLWMLDYQEAENTLGGAA